MSVYKAPDGYEYDTNTGLYYTQVLAEDGYGNRLQVVTWFDSASGEYSQHTYPVDEIGYDSNMDIPDGYIGKAAGFSLGNDTAAGYSTNIGAATDKVKAGIMDGLGQFGQKVSYMGRDIASKAQDMIPDADYDVDDEDYYAFTAYDRQGNPKQTGLVRKILYAFKRLVNACPVWMRLIPLAVLMLVDIILALVRPEEVSEVRCSIFLGFIVIPFIIVHLTDLNRKYGAKPLMIVQPVLLVIIGLLMMPSVIAVSFGIMKDTWLKPGVGPVFLWYICVLLGYVLTYFMVRKRFQKISLPMVELWTTVILVGMASMWVGVLAMWILALVIFVVMFVVIVPFMLKMGLSDGKAHYRDQYGNLYDEFGDRL